MKGTDYIYIQYKDIIYNNIYYTKHPLNKKRIKVWLQKKKKINNFIIVEILEIKLFVIQNNFSSIICTIYVYIINVIKLNLAT